MKTLNLPDELYERFLMYVWSTGDGLIVSHAEFEHLFQDFYAELTRQEKSVG